jgi:hypothetical protein
MNTKSAKAKGRRLQDWTAKMISNITGLEWGKDKDITPREMGQTGTDVRLSPSALALFPFSVECKNCERWNIREWIEQAKSNEKDSTDWLLIVKANRGDPVAILDATSFMMLMSIISEGIREERIFISSGLDTATYIKGAL